MRTALPIRNSMDAVRRVGMRPTAFVVSALLMVVAGRAQAPPGSSFERITPYVPTPSDVVEKMLELAQVTRDDRVYDLGSGDGRIVIMAAEKFGARAVGIELDARLVEESSKRIAELGLEKQAKIIQGNLFESDVRPATVVAIYLMTRVNERLRPQLEKQLRPGSRVVSHDFQIPGWKPDQVLNMMSKNSVPHTIYLYVRH